MIWQIIADFRTLIQNWWVSDRIRVSPVEVRIQQVQPGDLLTLGGVDFEVVDRQVHDASSCLIIRFGCITQRSAAELCCELSNCGQIKAVVWQDDSGCRILSTHELEVWHRR